VDTSWLALEVFDMTGKSVRHMPEFRRQMVDLVARRWKSSVAGEGFRAGH
jgi:hypothetical protein